MESSFIPQELLSPIRQQKVYLQIVKQFIELIEKGEFSAGMQLPPERELARRLGVSRASLREALTVLQMMGLVETVAGQGTFLTGKSAASVKYSLDSISVGESPFVIIQARKTVEPSIASFAALHRSEASLKKITEILDWVESDHSKDRILGNIFSEGDRQFHLEIAKATENPILISIQEIFHSLMGQDLWLTMMRHTSFATIGRWEEAYQEHHMILEAIRQHDARAAAHCARAHLQRVEKIMIEADLIPNIPPNKDTEGIDNHLSSERRGHR